MHGPHWLYKWAILADSSRISEFRLNHDWGGLVDDVMSSFHVSFLRRFFCPPLLASTFLAPAGCMVRPQVIEVPSSQGPREDLVVVGYAEVQGIPDQARVRIGVKERNQSSMLAMRAVEQKVKKLLGLLDGLGIPQSKVKTNQLTLNEIVEGQSPRQRLRRQLMEEPEPESKVPPKKVYEGIYLVEVELDDLSKVAGLVNALRVDAANVLSGIEFDMKNPEKYFNQARKQAVKNAIAQAQAIAQSSGHKLGAIQKISTAWGEEGDFGVPGGVLAGSMRDYEEGLKIPIRPGSMSFERMVRVSFAFEER